MATAASATYSCASLQPFMNPDEARLFDVRIAPSLNLARGTVLGEIIPNQLVTVTGTPTGGTFVLTYNGQSTTGIAYNASAATVAAALGALTSIGSSNNVSVTGSAGGPYTVTISQPSAALPSAILQLLTASGAGLTGGSSPSVTVAWTTTGITSWSIYAPYASGHSDGTQTAKCVLAYDAQTDASGNVTLSATAGQSGGEWGQTKPYASAYFRGVFKTEDLIGLDAGAVTNLGGSIVQGNLVSGVVQFGG